jgi:hypothetical protein
MRFILMVLCLMALATQARANCREARGPAMQTGPDVTCVPLTERLLVGLEGATKAEVTKAMKAIGRPVEIGLHFMSVADSNSGDLRVMFDGDRDYRQFCV